MGSEEQKRNGPTPVFLGLFICDQVITDLVTKKRSIIGIFDRFNLANYPSPVSFTILAKVTDGEGKYRGKLEIVCLDEDKIFGFAEGPLEIKNRMEVHDLIVTMTIEIPREGSYEVRFYVDDAYLGRSVFSAAKSE